MNITERVRDIFSRYNVNLEVTEQDRTELAEATLENGTVIYTDGDFFDEGAEVYIINDEGERIPLPPGDYVLADGVVLQVIEGGKVGKVDSSNAKDGDKRGVDPKASGKPANSGRTRQPGGEGDTPTNDAPAPTKDPVKTPSKTRQSADEKTELMDEYVTREMVEEMIREAIASMMMDDKEEEMKDEEKEEMSATENTQAVETEEVEIEVELASEEKAEDTELRQALSEIETLKTELAEVKKQAAAPGLRHAAPSQRQAEPVDLTSLTTAERVRVLAKQFSK